MTKEKNHGAVTMETGSEGPIIFFDGYCGLCIGFIDFILARDLRNRYRFATLQGQTAAERLPKPEIPVSPGADPLQTMVLLDAAGAYKYSEAALRAVAGLGGAWSLVGGLRCVPRPIRDSVYRIVAAHRHKLFGKSDTCRLPTAAEADRFLP